MEENFLAIEGLGAAIMEEEIGRILRANPNTPAAKAASQAASKVAEKNIRRSMFTDAQKALMINAKELPVDVQKALQGGNARFREADLYVRSVVTAGNGGQELIRTSTTERVGITNINTAKLPAGINVGVDRIGVRFAKSATITDPANVRYSNTDATTDAAILNGELTILVSDKTMVKLPMARFFNLGGTYASVPGNFDVVKLQRPFVIPEQQAIRIVVTLPDGSTLATANNFLEVRLMGAELATV